MPISRESLVGRLSKQKWTAYNIRLMDDLTTLPNKPDFMKTDPRLKFIMGFLKWVYRGNLRALHIADLGCLEGGYSLALALEGAQVIGIEARSGNLDKCNLLKEHFRLSNLIFVQDDVKNFDRQSYGEFDAVLALGLLYHLDSPVNWLSAVAKTTGLLFLDTHFAPVSDSEVGLMEHGRNIGPLANVTVNGREYSGRWYTEYLDELDLQEKRENALWSSYSNVRSFWLTKQSLVKSLFDAGFKFVLENPSFDAAVSRSTFVAFYTKQP